MHDGLWPAEVEVTRGTASCRRQSSYLPYEPKQFEEIESREA